ncbi:unnamed protein product, partial [Ectocarpus sp. 12 AP-2014]
SRGFELDHPWGVRLWIARPEVRTSERRLNLALCGNPVPKHKLTSCEVYKGSKRSLCRAAVIGWPMKATVATLLVASCRVGCSLKLGRAPLPWGTGSSRDGRCACSQQQQVASRSPSKLLRWSEARGTATSPSRLSAASEDADISTGGRFTVKEEEGLRADKGTPEGSIEDDSAEDAVTPELLDISDFLQPDAAFEQEEEKEEEEIWHTADDNGFFDGEDYSDVQG